jgi:hypothetical protein
MQVDNKILTSVISKCKVKQNNKKAPIEGKVMKNKNIKTTSMHRTSALALNEEVKIICYTR